MDCVDSLFGSSPSVFALLLISLSCWSAIPKGGGTRMRFQLVRAVELDGDLTGDELGDRAPFEEMYAT